MVGGMGDGPGSVGTMGFEGDCKVTLGADMKEWVRQPQYLRIQRHSGDRKKEATMVG